MPPVGAGTSHLEVPLLAALIAGVGLACLGLGAWLQGRRWRAERGRLFDAGQAFQAMTTGIVDFAVLLLDPEGRIRSWNEAARRIEGYEDAEIVGCHFSAFYPPEDRDSGKPARMLETARREGRSRDEGWRVRRDGSRFWAEVMVTAIRRADGSLHGFVKATRDLTERRRAEDAARIETLSQRFLQAEEALRRAAARDLRDAVAPLTRVRARVEDALARQEDAGLREGIAVMDHGLAQARIVAAGLRPPFLDDMGLPKALEWALQEEARGAGWHATFEATDLDARLPAEVESACYRVCEEALANAARHANARSVRVSVRRIGAEVEVEIVDDGVGFEPGARGLAAMSPEAFGLVAMAGRAELAGGHLEIDTRPGAGTRGRLVLPARGRREAALH